MTDRRFVVALALIALVSLASVVAADATGRWAATFETQIGEQQYTFEFVVKGTMLTGTIKGNLTGESKVADGKVDGNKISFVENAKFQDMELRIVYSGTLTSDNEMKLSRNVADLATEELVAKRVK
jgi:hypothetical protein